MDLVGVALSVTDDCVVTINNVSSTQSLIIDSTNGRRIIPPGETLKLTILSTTIYVLRAERATDPQGVSIP